MNIVRQLGRIAAVTLTLDALIVAPVSAQQGGAAALTARVTALSNAGKYAEAVPLAQQALALVERTFGPGHRNVAVALNNLATLYDKQSRYADAEPLYKRALAIKERVLGPNQPEVATSLHNLAVLYVNEARYADAEPLEQRALAIRERTLGRDHADVAVSLQTLGALYEAQARHADAGPLAKRTLEIFEKSAGPEHPTVAMALNALALIYENQGRYTDAEPLDRRALAIFEKALGPNHPQFAYGLSSLAGIYEHQGRYADAEALYKRALAVFEKTLGPDHPNVGAMLNNLAVVYDHQGRYADAEPLFGRALAIKEKALDPNHPDIATSLLSLAVDYLHEGRQADAEPLLKRALAIGEQALGPDHPDVALSLGDLAAVYKEQGRYGEALPLVQRTIASAHAATGIAVPVLLGAQEQGLISAAEANDAALDAVQRASQTAAAAAVNMLGVRLAAGTDRLAQLVRKDQDLAAETETLDKAIVAAASKEPGRRDAAGEQRMRERLRAIVAERQGLDNVFAADFPDYAALSHPLPLTVAEIQDLLAANEAMVLFAPGSTETYVFAVTGTTVAAKVIPLGTKLLSEKVAAFRRGLDVAALQQSAQGGTPVLFDLSLANELYVSLLGPVADTLKDAHHLLVVPSGPLTALPFHLLVTEKPAAAVPQPKDIASYRDAAWLIKRQAVSVLPALASLKALRQVAGRDPGGKPLVGFADPVFNPAERAAAQRRTATTRAAVSLGYGDFWQGAGIDRVRLANALPSLPDTADELKAVAGKLGAAPSDVHLGSDASEATVKRTALDDYKVVYFATHGLVAGDVAGLGEPSLALTLPRQPTGLDDGLLTASETAQLRLNADWVVLSACNTAAADKPGAEALSGLARAFFYAGARALLVSHWSVDSEAATRLTTSTFAILAADPKLGRAEAVRQAMLAYMNDTGSPLNAYPAFWAPFSVVGEGGTAPPRLARAPRSAGQAGNGTVTAHADPDGVPATPPALAPGRIPDAALPAAPASDAASTSGGGEPGEVTAARPVDGDPATPPDGPATPDAAVPSPLRPGPAATTTVIAEVNLRSAPAADSEVIAPLPAGSPVEVTGCRRGWCAVTWNGQSGYAIARNLSVGAPPQTGAYHARPSVSPRMPADFLPAPFFWLAPVARFVCRTCGRRGR